jgi:hypothetical protein
VAGGTILSAATRRHGARRPSHRRVGGDRARDGVRRGKPSDDIHSRFYGSQGETFDYVYEISDDGTTLTIWGGEKGSPAYYRGTFNDDDTANTGAWVYPDGGGYTSTMTKID